MSYLQNFSRDFTPWNIFGTHFFFILQLSSQFCSLYFTSQINPTQPKEWIEQNLNLSLFQFFVFVILSFLFWIFLKVIFCEWFEFIKFQHFYFLLNQPWSCVCDYNYIKFVYILHILSFFLFAQISNNSNNTFSYCISINVSETLLCYWSAWNWFQQIILYRQLRHYKNTLHSWLSPFIVDESQIKGKLLHTSCFKSLCNYHWHLSHMDILSLS